MKVFINDKYKQNPSPLVYLNTDYKLYFLMWMEECYHFNIVHCIFPFSFITI